MKTVASVKPTPALPKMISLKKIRDTDDLSSPVPDVGVKSLAGTVLFCHGKFCCFFSWIVFNLDDHRMEIFNIHSTINRKRDDD